jgi:3'(2'), 5'-bisphosphate nucleotidase
MRGAGGLWKEGPDELAVRISRIATKAGIAILEARQRPSDHRMKADGSPVTAADVLAEEIIHRELAEILPGVLVISEERDLPRRAEPLPGHFVIVDPLDGTRDYVNGSAEFTVNIALVERGRVFAGVVHAPALGRLFAGGSTAFEARVEPGALFEAAQPRRSLSPPAYAAGELIALESQSHPDPKTEALMARLPSCRRRQVSSSLKFALIAAGEADVYVRAAPLSEWDVAAGDAVLTGAGGAVTDLNGERLKYGHLELGLKVRPFLAASTPELARDLVGCLGIRTPDSITRVT